MRYLSKMGIAVCLVGLMASASASIAASSKASVQTPGIKFAIRLFRQEVENRPDANVLISPFSARFALSMAANGAAGKTLDQMVTVLGANADQLSDLNQQNKDCKRWLLSGDKVKLEIANAIYADKSYPVKKSFLDLCQREYSAEVQNEDFSNPLTVVKINKWCNEKTHGKITSIIDSLQKSQKMVLLNALYFKGDWQKTFEKSETRDDTFTLSSGAKLPVKMMHQAVATDYLKGTNFSAISLPYVGEKQRLYIFLPDQSTKLSALEDEFTSENWEKWRWSFRTENMDVSLPRFKMENETDLSNSLRTIGLETAFTKEADFSRMSSGKLLIDKVLQRTYLDVNEQGTEAAAVTKAAMATAAYHRPAEFRVDHPFVVALFDEPTGQILFLGAVTKPN